MDIARVLRDSWRITWHTGALWVLAIAMLVMFVPLGALTVAFSTAANLATFNDPTLSPFLAASPELEQLTTALQTASLGQWLGLAIVAFAALITTTTLSLLVQAASMRGVVQAAEGQKVSLGQVLRLGRARTLNIFKLSLVFGAVIALLGILPSLALLLVGKSSPIGLSLIHLVQTGLTPITTVLNIGLLLLVMSIALEDYSPRAAFGRVGAVFKQGWWAFLIIIGLSSAAAFIALFIFLLPPLLLFPLVAINVELGLFSTLGAFGCTGLLALFFFIFTVIFTQALYALVYREAARQTVPA